MKSKNMKSKIIIFFNFLLNLLVGQFGQMRIEQGGQVVAQHERVEYELQTRLGLGDYSGAGMAHLLG